MTFVGRSTPSLIKRMPAFSQDTVTLRYYILTPHGVISVHTWREVAGPAIVDVAIVFYLIVGVRSASYLASFRR